MMAKDLQVPTLHNLAYQKECELLMNENIKKINNISLNTPPQSFIDRVQAFIDDYRFQVDELIKKDYMKQFGREPMLNLSNDIF